MILKKLRVIFNSLLNVSELNFATFFFSFLFQQIPLRQNSDVTATWLNPPIKPQLKLYFFNVTNAKAFLEGAKPRLEEVGPFVYE